MNIFKAVIVLLCLGQYVVGMATFTKKDPLQNPAKPEELWSGSLLIIAAICELLMIAYLR